ncbi:MAG: oligosaccharide flippase family protein [Plectolyngbya sp. WJT66-NPBG17]|jgi:O-antigen/teichoic acid export membrane protein/acetyltransferase-like isoleucine patch superfamily enzyme|nr:oligosaccharide flippase family protein [Plectolyngbya sp. WJT66-NPBG17]
METHRVSTKNPLMKVLSKIKTIAVQNPVVRKAAGSFAVKVFSLGIAFITNICLARTLGASGYGDYIYAITWVGFLGVPACLGLPEYLVREVAIYNAKAEWGLLKGLLRRSNEITLILSIVVGAIAAITAAWVAHANFQLLVVFWISLLSLPFATLTSLRQGSMRGLNQVVKSDFPELLIKPLLFLALLGMIVVFQPSYLTVYSIMGVYVLTVGVAFWVGVRQLRTALPTPIKEVSSIYRTQHWFRGSLPFLMIVAMFAINQQIDVLMLGAIKGTSAAGIYTVVGRGAQLIQFSLTAVSAATGPTIAQLYATRNLAQVEQVAHSSARLLWFSCAAISTSLIAVGYWFLLIFGAAFVQGQTALTILCLGYMISAPFELSGLLLLMTGRERDTAIGTGITAVLNVFLNALLIPKFGLEGASIATATSIIMRGLFFSLRTYQTLGIVPNPLKFSQSANGEPEATNRIATVSRSLSRFPSQLKRHRQLKRRYQSLTIDASTLLNYDDIQAIRIGAKVKIGGSSEITVTNVDRVHQGRLTIAGGTTIAPHAKLFALGEKIFIGQNCQIAERVSLIASSSDLAEEPRSQPTEFNPGLGIYLGDQVWLGARVAVRSGCAIGKYSIVAADSVITENIPENEVWAGNPAKKIGDRSALSAEEIAALMEVA